MLESTIQQSLDQDPSKLWPLLELFSPTLDADIGGTPLAHWVGKTLGDWERFVSSTQPPALLGNRFPAECAKRRIWLIPGALSAILGSAARNPQGGSLMEHLRELLSLAIIDSDPRESAWVANLPAAEAEFLAPGIADRLCERVISLTEGVGKAEGIRPGWLLAFPLSAQFLMSRFKEESPERAWGTLVAAAMLAKRNGGRPLYWAYSGIFDCLTKADWGEGGKVSSEWACGAFRERYLADESLQLLVDRQTPGLMEAIEPWVLGSKAERGAAIKSRPKKV